MTVVHAFASLPSMHRRNGHYYSTLDHHRFRDNAIEEKKKLLFLFTEEKDIAFFLLKMYIRCCLPVLLLIALFLHSKLQLM